ncbi:ATP-binding cassette subfamily G member 4-like isoform X2 [Calliopsis andreniformis]|uniref:ATP-binding cassette subfamily G member 4-like isoform X2 n=1 Tax=Calliopsis andreniformis TaxID=337506 RepID=UPI003FCD65E4
MYQRAVLVNLPKTQSIDIEFSNVVYEVPQRFRCSSKQILKGISGSFRSGELTAIMGPSGAGKSTLLNILTGFQRDHWKGQIEYIGKEGKHTWNEYKKHSCYIQQDDNLHSLFTVLEAMWMATNLKIGTSISKKAKEILIDDVLDNLDLSKTKETKCGKLSGGQKKRLSIALELVDNPPVMFLDEPTTGLDALSSYQCIKLLHNLAKSGRTIICTIHQPSAVIYEMFDNVYLLADGRRMYEGASKNTIEYFASIGLNCPKYHNPADYMIEVVSKEYGDYNDQLVTLANSNDRYWRLEKRIIKKDSLSDIANGNKAAVLIKQPSETYKFFILLHRCMIQLFRDWTVTHLKLILHLIVGILLGLLFTDCGKDGSKTINNVGFLLVSSVYLCYTSTMPAVLKFPSEFPTLKKERFNNWFLMFLGVAILTAMIAESFGLLVGTLCNPINGTFIAAILTCGMLALAGFLALYSHMPSVLFYVSYISYLKYSLHALLHAMYGFNREMLNCPKNYCHYRVPELVLTEFSMTDRKYWTDIVLLFCYYAIFKFMAYCTLKKKLSST